MSSSCDYANARISARRGQLLGASGLREVASRTDLEGQVEVLRRSLWGRAIGQERAEGPRDLPSVERALTVEEHAQRGEVERFVGVGVDRDREVVGQAGQCRQPNALSR